MASVETISSTSLTAGTANTGTASSASSVDYDAFLTLLVTQLKNQDPTEPTDSGEFLAQLASFSGVEQQLQTNEKLAELVQANLVNQAANITGHTISSADGSQRGVVVSVTLTNNGLIAKLDDGSNLVVGNGVIIE